MSIHIGKGQCSAKRKSKGRKGEPTGSRCTNDAMDNGFCSVHGGANDARYCERCSRPDALNRHHRVRRDKGGPDSPENLVDLCEECHREWHQYFEDSVEFAIWLDTPPAAVIVRVLIDCIEHPDIPIRDVSKAWQLIRAGRIDRIRQEAIPVPRHRPSVTLVETTHTTRVIKEGIIQCLDGRSATVTIPLRAEP